MESGMTEGGAPGVRIFNPGEGLIWREKSKVLGPTYEEGKSEVPLNWRKKFGSREEMPAYLKTGERYWFSEEWYGSEKRKTKARRDALPGQTATAF